MTKTVVVGMSGGVDSSVSALLLKQQGYRVIGLFMKNWEEIEGACPSVQEYEDVAKVCAMLDIPHYTVNFTKEYWDLVFTEFLEELKLGHTPNPDVLCNREIKFKLLLEKALSLGADFLATGHYAQIAHNRLKKGADKGKDQSYFLYTLQDAIFHRVLFPIGHLEKHEVRTLAKAHGLATADKKDSTGICFIGERNFKSFLSQYLPYQKGNFETLDGNIIGEHDGIAYYTIGQRKGLNIGGPGKAWFVVGKDVARNVVFIEQGDDHPALYRQTLLANNLSWVAASAPSLPLHCQAKIRYRQEDQECVIEAIHNNCASIRFLQPQRAVTPRQSIVFYDKDICLGGGMIL